MNFIKILARVINIILLSVLFLIATGYALSPSSEEIFGIKYFNITNILYYIGYIFFGIALLQYIRKKSVGWHNFYLAFMLVIFSWFFLLIIIFHPLFDEALESNNNIYVEIIELYFDKRELSASGKMSFLPLSLGVALVVPPIGVGLMGLSSPLFISGIITRKRYNHKKLNAVLVEYNESGKLPQRIKMQIKNM